MQTPSIHAKMKAHEFHLFQLAHSCCALLHARRPGHRKCFFIASLYQNTARKCDFRVIDSQFTMILIVDVDQFMFRDIIVCFARPQSTAPTAVLHRVDWHLHPSAVVHVRHQVV